MCVMSDSHKVAETFVSHVWSMSDCGVYGPAGEEKVAQTPHVSTPASNVRIVCFSPDAESCPGNDDGADRRGEMRTGRSVLIAGC